jgi:hypothetical protein
MLRCDPNECRSALDAVETRVEHLDHLAIHRRQPIAKDTLMLPDRLQQTLGRRVMVIVQDRRDPAPHSPLGIYIIQNRRHLCATFCPAQKGMSTLDKSPQSTVHSPPSAVQARLPIANAAG